jgi:hypothetical protein
MRLRPSSTRSRTRSDRTVTDERSSKVMNAGRHEKGQVLPVLLVVLVALAAAAVMLFQIGRTTSLAAEATSAADAAALAAGIEMRDQLNAQVASRGLADTELVDEDAMWAAAQESAARNGGTVTNLVVDGLSVTVTVETVEALDEAARSVDSEGARASTFATAELQPTYTYPGGLSGGVINPSSLSDIQAADWKEFKEEIAGKPLDIVALGTFLQSLGFHVAEHPAFGGVCTNGCHVENSWHYRNGAIDVNFYGGDEKAAIDAVVGQIAALGYHVLWQVEDHYDHLHVDIGAPGAPGEYAGSGYGPASFEVILVE